MEAYPRLGFTGAVWSTDVTNFSWNMCPGVDTRSYKGKEGFPTLAYKVTVDHSKRVLEATCGSPGARNDKTIVRYDDTVFQVRMNKGFTDLLAAHFGYRRCGQLGWLRSSTPPLLPLLTLEWAGVLEV
ncbi:unnamed protein product [Discosporangium mesarthrocarpum]